jgi:hypothetical protein
VAMNILATKPQKNTAKLAPVLEMPPSAQREAERQWPKYLGMMRASRSWIRDPEHRAMFALPDDEWEKAMAALEAAPDVVERMQRINDLAWAE